MLRTVKGLITVHTVNGLITVKGIRTVSKRVVRSEMVKNVKYNQTAKSSERVKCKMTRTFRS